MQLVCLFVVLHLIIESRCQRTEYDMLVNQKLDKTWDDDYGATGTTRYKSLTRQITSKIKNKQRNFKHKHLKNNDVEVEVNYYEPYTGLEKEKVRANFNLRFHSSNDDTDDNLEDDVEALVVSALYTLFDDDVSSEDFELNQNTTSTVPDDTDADGDVDGENYIWQVTIRTEVDWKNWMRQDTNTKYNQFVDRADNKMWNTIRRIADYHYLKDKHYLSFGVIDLDSDKRGKLFFTTVIAEFGFNTLGEDVDLIQDDLEDLMIDARLFLIDGNLHYKWRLLDDDRDEVDSGDKNFNNNADSSDAKVKENGGDFGGIGILKALFKEILP